MLEMARGQSLWILTKIAMVFFVGSLALIIVAFGGFAKTGLCESSAQGTSSRIANAINQIMNSPLEDERRVIPLENSLAVGEGKSSLYHIVIAKRVPEVLKDANQLVITTSSEHDAGCSAGIQASYPNSLEFSGPPTAQAPSGSQRTERLFLISDRHEPAQGPFEGGILLKPSLPEDKETANNLRTKFIVVMSCTNKTITREKYVFLQDCIQDVSENCINFDSATTIGGNDVSSICGFT